MQGSGFLSNALDAAFGRLVAVMPGNLGGALLMVGGLLFLLTFVEKLTRRGRRPRKPPRSPGWLARLLARKPAFELTEDTPGTFQARAVHNNAERALHHELEALMPQHFPARTRLLSQVSLDEILYTDSRRDWYTISGKRVDFLIVDAGFQPLCAIEYQGAGHHGRDRGSARNARHRDWQKRRALRLADVPLIEVPARYDRRMLAALLGDVTGRRPSPTPSPDAPHQATLASPPLAGL